MYSARFVQRLVLLVCAAFLLPLTPAAAEEVSKDKIVRALKGGNAELRAKVLDYLDEQADEGLASEVLIKIVGYDLRRPGPRDSTLRMIRMLGKLDTPESLEALANCLQAADYHFATVAAEALGSKDTDEAFESLNGALKSKHFKSVFGFRRAVVGSASKRTSTSPPRV